MTSLIFSVSARHGDDGKRVAYTGRSPNRGSYTHRILLCLACRRYTAYIILVFATVSSLSIFYLFFFGRFSCLVHSSSSTVVVSVSIVRPHTRSSSDIAWTYNTAVLTR